MEGQEVGFKKLGCFEGLYVWKTAYLLLLRILTCSFLFNIHLLGQNEGTSKLLTVGYVKLLFGVMLERVKVKFGHKYFRLEIFEPLQRNGSDMYFGL